MGERRNSAKTSPRDAFVGMPDAICHSEWRVASGEWRVASGTTDHRHNAINRALCALACSCSFCPSLNSGTASLRSVLGGRSRWYVYVSSAHDRGPSRGGQWPGHGHGHRHRHRHRPSGPKPPSAKRRAPGLKQAGCGFPTNPKPLSGDSSRGAGDCACSKANTYAVSSAFFVRN
jgi:hypothetical protein